MNDPSVTMGLHRAGEGEAEALGQAYAAAYDDLKRTAHAQLRRGGGELDTTSLVNETYLKLAHADARCWWTMRASCMQTSAAAACSR